MTPARLENFLAIVDSGSARSAAQRLHVTESAVSASLAALHQEVGVPLLERQGRGLVLTDSGAAFALYARQILGLLDESVVAARSGIDPGRGQLRLGAVTTAGEYLVPQILSTFRRDWPNVEVSLKVGVRDSILADLADHRLDVVIAGRPPRGRGLVVRAIRKNSLVLVGAAGAPPDLENATWLLREPGSGTRATALGLIEALGLEPHSLSLGSHGAVVASATLGLGITLVSLDAVGRDLDEGTLAVIETPETPLRRPWHVLTGANLTATSTLFVQHLLADEPGHRFAPPRRLKGSRKESTATDSD